MGKKTILIICIFANIQLVAQTIYKQKSAPIESRIQDLLSKMTVDEKILQLNQYFTGLNSNINNLGEQVAEVPAEIGSLILFGHDPIIRNLIQKKAIEKSRLGIPILFGFDVIHGFRTIYPIPLAQACSWNPSLVQSACAFAAKESRLSGIEWTFSPMIDVARDPRWGRVSEGYGEDPYTNAVFGVASVKGYQGNKFTDEYSIAACLKHFVGYGRSEGGRDYNSTDISTQSLWDTYLPPFEACIKAGAVSLMSAFNDLNGIPTTANHFILTEILKEKWHHDGFVVSDWSAIYQLIVQGYAKDNKEATLKSFMAGVDMDMCNHFYADNLKELINEKKIPMSKIDDAIARILRVKFRLGLFETPYTTIVDEKNRYLNKEDIKIAAQLAEESMVLLKNIKNTLPLSKSIKKLAVIGPMAKDKANIIGSWSYNGQVNDVQSIYDGLEKEFGTNVQLNYSLGCDFESVSETAYQSAILTAEASDAIVICLGEMKEWSGENASRSTISLPSVQEKLVENLKKTGKPIILILSSGRPLELKRLEPLADAIIEIWQPGIAGGSPLAGILTGRLNPSGKLAITFPLSSGQIPIYYDMKQSARPYAGKYQDIPTEPLYWFGYGLSYSSFTYSKAKVSQSVISKNEKLNIEVSVHNSSQMTGKETVFWYISDPVASVTRPVKELKFFEKKEIKSGETSTFKFEIDPMRDLSFSDDKGQRQLEAGEFYIYVNNEKIKIELKD